MTYKVVIAKPARRDLQEYVRFISTEQESPEQARIWSRDIKAEIAKLAYLADSFNIIEEGMITERPSRSFQFHSHRVIYQIDFTHSRVVVIRIHHGARQPLGSTDIQDLDGL